MAAVNFTKPAHCRGNVNGGGEDARTSCSSNGCAGPTVLAVYERGSGPNGLCSKLSAVCCKETVNLPSGVAIVNVAKNNKSRGAVVTAASIKLSPEQTVQGVPGALATPDYSIRVNVMNADGKRVWPR